MAERVVRTIPATVDRFTAAPINVLAKRRVAAYARVSTDMEEQLTSYEAQVRYYTEYIKSREDWEFAGVYADDYVIIGISGKNPIKSRVLGTCPCYFFAGARYIPLKVKIRQKKGRDKQ